GFVLIRRLNRAHVELVEGNRRLQEERASELEAFAGRVAHDILSPLGTVSLSLDLARKSEDPDARRAVLGRGVGAVSRIKTLVSGLLAFARAGGRPDGGARADLGAAIGEVVEALEPTAKDAAAELSAAVDGPHVVA